jgi:hypothetical protein
MICRKDSFQKPTLFSLGHKVLDANASNTDAVIGEIHAVLELG